LVSETKVFEGYGLQVVRNLLNEFGFSRRGKCPQRLKPASFSIGYRRANARCGEVARTLQKSGTEAQAFAEASLAQGGLYLVEPIMWLENLAGFCPVGRADNAIALHHVNQMGGAAIPYP